MLGQVFPTAGRLSGKIAKGGGSTIEIMCGCSAAMEIVSKYPQTQVHLLKGADPTPASEMDRDCPGWI